MTSRLATWGRVWISASAVALAVAWFARTPSAAADPPPPAIDGHVPNGLCLMCHGQPGLTMTVDGQTRTIAAVDQTAFAASAHGGKTCVECHADQSSLPHVQPGSTAQYRRATPCQECHRDAYDGYMESPHGTMAELRDNSGPTCASCHGSAHTVRPVKEWTDQERAQVCAGCHPGAGTGFLQALSHQAPSPSFLPSVYFAGRFLVILASSSLAFGIIHVELDLLRWLVRRWRAGSGRRARWESS
jgi:predicted CXXCH cytochrome family protein